MAKKRKWAPGQKTGSEKKNLIDTPAGNISGGNHFATRMRANEFVSIMRNLPDLDPVLKKLGKNISDLQELLSDSHLESVWSIRCAATSGAEWFMAAGDDSRAAQEAADAFADELKGMNVPRIIEEMMDAVAYGYSPLEVLWTAKDNRWGIQNIVGKPPQWFEFDQENNLLFKTGGYNTEELPKNRFLLVQHRSSYANPYGVKVFSKCYWPVTFKKNGWRWWTVFVEKYGGAFTYGKYPLNADDQFKNNLLSSLEQLHSDAVAIIPEGSEITITSASDKGGSSEVHERYIQMANAEISKAVLGQTLTTEIGEKGSYAAATAHNLVREHLATSDRTRISAVFNQLAALYTAYNFGEVALPKFSFVKDEDLKAERAKRDVDLYKIGFRPKKSYFIRHFQMQEDDFDLQEEGSQFALCEHQHTSFGKTASAGNKALKRDTRLMDNFMEPLLTAAQNETDQTIDAFIDGLGQVHDFDEAFEALGDVYERRNKARCASLVSEARYAAGQIGASSAKPKKRGRKNG